MKWVVALILAAVAPLYAAAPGKAKSIATQAARAKPAKSLTSHAQSSRTHSSVTIVRRSSVRLVPVSRSSSYTASAHAARSRSPRGIRPAPVAPPPSYQLRPDPDRIQEIQKALAERGYFSGEVNGEWRDDSVDALKRFQTDQKLLDDGKISALSLIALGLGPKHTGSTSSVVNPAPASVSTAALPSTPRDSTFTSTPTPPAPRPANPH